MAFNKRTWKGRQGTGLNKFSIDGATPVTVVNQPDSVTEQGDALSAGNLNDLEQRIFDAFEDTADSIHYLREDIEDGTTIAGKARKDQNGNVIDQTYETKAEASDLKNALTAVDHRVQNLEQAKGDYVPVDSTKGVISVPSGKGKWAVVEKLRGVSRAENQLAKALNSTNWQFNNATGSFSDGVATFTATASRGNIGMNSNDRTLPNVAGRVVLISVDVKTTTATTSVRLYSYGGYAVKSCVSSTSWQTISMLVTTNSSWGYDLTGNNRATVEDARSGSWDAVQVKNWVIRDLTLYFGSTVPTLAEIQQYYPWLLEPSDYGTSLVDSVYEGVESKGANIWDEVTENGYIDLTDGSFHSNSSYLSAKNYCACVPMSILYGMNTTLHGNPSSDMKIFFYDGSKNYIGYYGINETTITVPSNAYFFKLGFSSLYGNSYHNDVQISLCPSGTPTTANTTYHSYVGTLATLSLPTPITLRSAGSVAEEFDLKTGEKTNPLGSVDLGTLTWYYDSAHTRFYADIADAKPTVSENPANYLCAKYVNVSPNVFDLDVPNMAMRGGVGSGMVWIRDTSYNDATTFKNAMNGVILYYEKATPNDPTQLTPIQNPTILTEAGGTISAQTEEPIDGNFSVGFITL